MTLPSHFRPPLCSLRRLAKDLRSQSPPRGDVLKRIALILSIDPRGFGVICSFSSLFPQVFDPILSFPLSPLHNPLEFPTLIFPPPLQFLSVYEKLSPSPVFLSNSPSSPFSTGRIPPWLYRMTAATRTIHHLDLARSSPPLKVLFGDVTALVHPGEDFIA